MSPAYVAGYFDGDGQVRLRRAGGTKHAHIRAEVRISGVHRAHLEAIRAVYGGRVRTSANRSRAIHCLVWSSLEDVRGFLAVVGPYLVLKRPQAEALREYLERHATGRRVHPTDEDWALVAHITRLNHGPEGGRRPAG